MKNIKKSLLLIFFIIVSLLLLMCANDIIKQLNLELSENKNNEKICKLSNIEINHLVDPSIYINEQELDLFKNVQYDFDIDDENTKKIIRIFKQIGLNFNPKYGLKIEKENVNTNISWNIDTTILYTIKSNNPLTKPNIPQNNKKIPDSLDGYYIFSFGYNNIIKNNDFEVYYYLPSNNGIYPLYRNGQIVNTLENMTLAID